MAAMLEDIAVAENEAKLSYDELIKAKTAEVDALAAAIEERTKRFGDLGVQLVEMREEVKDNFVRASLLRVHHGSYYGCNEKVENTSQKC